MQQQLYKKTRYGVINYTERRFVTRRRPEHYFVKYGGFAISETVLNECELEDIKEVVIRYEGKNGNKIFKISIEKINKMEIYDYKGDIQRVLPIKEMEKVGEEIDKKRI